MPVRPIGQARALQGDDSRPPAPQQASDHHLGNNWRSSVFSTDEIRKWKIEELLFVPSVAKLSDDYERLNKRFANLLDDYISTSKQKAEMMSHIVKYALPTPTLPQPTAAPPSVGHATSCNPMADGEDEEDETVDEEDDVKGEVDNEDEETDKEVKEESEQDESSPYNKRGRPASPLEMLSKRRKMSTSNRKAVESKYDTYIKMHFPNAKFGPPRKSKPQVVKKKV